MPETSFSKNNTGAMRAAATIVVLFCHLNNTMSARVENPLMVLTLYGAVAVGIFFYYTGYNLLYSYVNRAGDWSRDFWLKKLARIYIPFMLVNLAGRITWLAQGSRTGLRTIAEGILGIHVLNTELWYIQSCMLVYLLFYALFMLYDRFLKKYIQGSFMPALLCLGLFCAYSFIYGRFGSYDGKDAIRPWPLLLGMLVGIYGKSLIKYWAKYKWEIFFLCAFIGVAIPQYLRYELFVELPLIGRVDYVQLRIFIVAVMANTLIIGENIQSRLLALISRYSLYIYLSHAVLYVLYRSSLIYIKSDLLYLAVYLMSVAVSAYFLEKLAKWLERLLPALRDKVLKSRA